MPARKQALRMMRMAGALWLTALLATGLVGTACAQSFVPGQITVMTQNQYLGADLSPILGASSPASFNNAVLQLLRQRAASGVMARLGRQADRIVARRPDLVGLQEVTRVACQDLPPTRGACADPSIRGAFLDQLTATLAALRARGAAYEMAARVVNIDLREVRVAFPRLGTYAGLPFSIGGKVGLVTLYDQDVILKRSGLTTTPVAFSGCRRSAQGCNYRTEASIPLPLPGNPTALRFKRGYVGVDAAMAGRTFRVVNTHLEVREIVPGNPAAAAIQAGQASELLAALGNAPMAPGAGLILLGDFNSSPADDPPAPIVSPYRRLTGAGFVDAFKVAFGNAAGFTCCQDADLRNPQSKLYERIDLILARPPVLTQAVRLDGRLQEQKTAPIDGVRLWPSDHAGVAARLKF